MRHLLTAVAVCAALALAGCGGGNKGGVFAGRSGPDEFAVARRAPLVVPVELWSDWLDPDSDAEGLLDAVLAAGPRPMTIRRVSSAVNAVRNTGPRLLEPAPEPVPSEAGRPRGVEQVPLW